MAELKWKQIFMLLGRVKRVTSGGGHPLSAGGWAGAAAGSGRSPLLSSVPGAPSGEQRVTLLQDPEEGCVAALADTIYKPFVAGDSAFSRACYRSPSVMVMLVIGYKATGSNQRSSRVAKYHELGP